MSEERKENEGNEEWIQNESGWTKAGERMKEWREEGEWVKDGWKDR